jgi:hypothetical protein
MLGLLTKNSGKTVRKNKVPLRGRTPRNLLRSRIRNAFGLLCLVHMIHFQLKMKKMETAHKADVNYCPGEVHDYFSPSWLDARTKWFTAFWRSHKLRNIAIYSCVSMRKTFILKQFTYHMFHCPEYIYDSKYDELFAVPAVCISHRCLKPLGNSHYIYAEFILKTIVEVTSLDVTPPLPQVNGYIAVLVEPRKHPLYEYTVKQVMSTLGPDWALQLFVSSENEHFVRKTFDIKIGGTGQNISITRLKDYGLDDMSRLGNKIQSALSAHASLYEAIPSEFIFWFQTDVLLRHAPQQNWLSYSYVGSEWQGCQYPACTKETCEAVCGGGNSGLSLRRKSKLLRVATRGTLPTDLWGVQQINHTSSNTKFDDPNARFSSDELHDNSRDSWFEDDLQLSYKLSKLGMLPIGSISPRFAISQALPTEGLCRASPSGLHKPWLTPWIDPFDIVWLLEKPFQKCMNVFASQGLGFRV